MTVARLATYESPTKVPLGLTLTGAKLLLKTYFAARRAGLSSAGELALYAHLIVRAIRRESDWVQISTEALAKELDVTERTMTRWLAALTELGWIERRAPLRADGTREIARTRLPALTRTRPATPATAPAVTQLERTGEGGAITAAEARPVLEQLRHAPELLAIGDRATRERIRAEIVFSVLRCALARLPDMALRLNVARKKLRQRVWRTPRTMPSDFHASFTRLVRELEPPSPPAAPALRPCARPEIVAPGAPSMTAAAHIDVIARRLGQTTSMSEKELLFDTQPRASSSPPIASGGVA